MLRKVNKQKYRLVVEKKTKKINIFLSIYLEINNMTATIDFRRSEIRNRARTRGNSRDLQLAPAIHHSFSFTGSRKYNRDITPNKTPSVIFYHRHASWQAMCRTNKHKKLFLCEFLYGFARL